MSTRLVRRERDSATRTRESVSDRVLTSRTRGVGEKLLRYCYILLCVREKNTYIMMVLVG